MGKMDGNTAKNCHLYKLISQKLFQSQVIHSKQPMNKKLLSLRKSQFTRRLYSHSQLVQNAAWTNSTSGKNLTKKKYSSSSSRKYLKETNTPLRFVKKESA